MQIDALEVSQPLNPGDALVREYQIIGPAPDNHLSVDTRRFKVYFSARFRSPRDRELFY